MKNILIIFMLFSGSLVAQNYIPYYNITNEAVYRLMITKEYEKAEKLYLDAFKIEKPLISDYYQMARCYAGKGDTINMIKYLKLSSTEVSFNPLLFVNSKRDSVLFYKYKQQQSYIACMKEIEKTNEKHKTALKTDKELKIKKDTIAYFLRVFQQSRKNILKNMTDLTREQKDSLRKLADASDVVLRKSLLEFVEKNGFPEYSAPGSMLSGSDFISVLLISMTEEEFEKYNPLMQRELKKGNLAPYDYGYIYDKVQSRTRGNKCSYFSVNNMNKDCWSQSIEERKKIGLSIYLDGSNQNILKGNNKKLPWVGTLVN